MIALPAARGRSSWGQDIVTEGLKVFTVRRNRWVIAIATTAVVAVPWVFIAIFDWLAGEGIVTSPLEVIALSLRNQTAGAVLLLLLGLQAYLSDAGNGTLPAEIGGGRRASLIRAKLMFGLSAAVAYAVLAVMSSLVAWTILGAAVLTPAQAPWGVTYWLVAGAGAGLNFFLHYLIGLMTGVLVRNKGMAVALSVLGIWVILPMLSGAARQSLPAGMDLLWLLPTDLAANVTSWMPGGSSLLTEPARGILLMVTLLAGWLILGMAASIWSLRRRAFYPADQC